MDSDYNYSYSTADSSLDPGAALAIFGVMAVIGIIGYVVFALFLSKIFKKAGVEAWKAWVPVYNQWVFLEIGGQKGWLSLLTILAYIPIINFIGWIGAVVAAVFSCIAAYHIGLKLQKEGWFVILYILVSPVWLIWLAVDDSKWQSKVPAATAAPGYQPPVAAKEKESTPPTA